MTRVEAKWTTVATRRWRHAALACVVLAGCHRAAAVSREALAPVVTRVQPVPLIVREGEIAALTIVGERFADDSNMVSFGPQVFTAIRATNRGTTLRVVIPDRAPGAGGAAPMFWVSGEYPLVVSNRSGRSATVSVSLRVQP